MPNELETLSKEMIAALEAEMKAVLAAGAHPPTLFYGMLQYHMGWVDEQMRPLEVNGGKRIRPLLCLLTCAAAGGEWPQAVPAAAAIEILHNFSLIHDDIEDASPMRRGRQTLWQIWGIPQAINAGDAMFAIAHLALNRLVNRGVDPVIVVEALRRFDETCVQLTQGQHADMDFEQRTQVSVADYIEMITGKTAVLLALSAELGARIAGASPDTVAHYYQYGLQLGLAFQVIDDMLGIWGDETLTGKSAATDLITKKKTLPVLHGLAQSAKLQQLYGQTIPEESFVAQAITLLDETGSHEFARITAETYSANAIHHLEAASPTGMAARALAQLTHLLLKRNY